MLAVVLDKVFPYLIALIVGAALGMYARGTEDAKVLAEERAAFQKEMTSITADAALAQAKALADHTVQEGRIQTLDDQLTKEKEAHENDTRTYAAALAAGTQRMRIAVTSCTARGHDVPAAASAASVDDGSPAVADIDPETASRVATFAGDDQREIDKLRALQGYVCSINPALPACQAPAAAPAQTP